jgi:hypothetical protein
MNCREFKENLDRISEAEAKPGAEMMGHVKECPSCAEELKSLISLREALSAGKKTRIPADFNSKVWKKIGVPSPSILDRIFGARPDMDSVLRGAVAAAVLIFVVFMAHGTFVKNEVRVAVKPAEKSAVKVASLPKVVKKTAKRAEKKLPDASAVAMEKLVPVKNDSPPAQELAYAPVLLQESQDNGPGKGGVKPEGNMTVVYGNGQKNSGSGSSAANSKAGSMSAAAEAPKGTPIQTSPKENFKDGDLEIMSNVFNPLHGGSMKIRYIVRDGTDVSLVVYSRNGEAVRTLFKGFRQPGEYEQAWNGTDDSGAVLGADIYFVYIKTDLVEKKIKAAIIK